MYNTVRFGDHISSRNNIGYNKSSFERCLMSKVRIINQTITINNADVTYYFSRYLLKRTNTIFISILKLEHRYWNNPNNDYRQSFSHDNRMSRYAILSHIGENKGISISCRRHKQMTKAKMKRGVLNRAFWSAKNNRMRFAAAGVLMFLILAREPREENSIYYYLVMMT